MKYFFVLFILFLSACSLDKDPIKKSIVDMKLSNILKKTTDFNTMTFDEFNIFLKDYSDKKDYPDIIN